MQRDAEHGRYGRARRAGARVHGVTEMSSDWRVHGDRHAEHGSVVFGVVSGGGGEEHQEDAEGGHDGGFDGDAEACSHEPVGSEGCGSCDGAYDRCHEGFEFAGEQADQIDQQDHCGPDENQGR